MPGPYIAGTFSTGSVPAANNASDVLNPPTGRTSMKLTLTGLDVSNTVKTQKRTSPGGTWVDQTTYNADQAATAVTVAATEEWRLVQVSQQAIRDVRYVMDAQQ